MEINTGWLIDSEKMILDYMTTVEMLPILNIIKKIHLDSIAQVFYITLRK